MIRPRHRREQVTEARRRLEIQLKRKWTLDAPLGAGGFGRVFEARGPEGTAAVVKLIPKRPGADREMLFSGEGIRNVVPIIDSGDHGDDWVIVMPRAEKSLRDHLTAAGGILTPAETMSIVRDITIALSDLDGDVVHRDIKPENTLLLDGVWCLSDFGLARYADAATATHTWKLSGTNAYVAPERWRLQRATIASDVYSVGVLAYELLTGTIPFQGPDFNDQHLHSDPPPLTGIPPHLAALVEDCLFKAPEARPTPSNLLARLERFMTAPQASGLAALAEANREETSRRASEARKASQFQTEQERRGELFTSAKKSLERIASNFLDSLSSVASAGTIKLGREGGWIFTLGQAQLGFSAANEAQIEVWKGEHTVPFDVIAYGTISLRFPANYYGYQGRSHAIWFCDAQTKGTYQWFETAFMTHPMLSAKRLTVEPFALAPDSKARAALNPGMDVHQVAWRFTPIDSSDMDALITRWAEWLAAAAMSQLTQPSTMPEHRPEGSWRSSGY
ncbi:serine/threonine-protein kinase [Streptomyces sp. NPDC057271]|uniref:serine/threonine-protein kinase n=1 Tax=unclassified Streptomyces TaxID=2593676 RepID=UPI0036323DA1